MAGGGDGVEFGFSTKRSRSNSKDNAVSSEVREDKTTAAGETEAKASSNVVDIDKDEKTDAEKAGFNPDMTILQCFWLVATIATPPIIGMLLYILI